MCDDPRNCLTELGSQLGFASLAQAFRDDQRPLRISTVWLAQPIEGYVNGQLWWAIPSPKLTWNE
jgi:hypothetical protein